MFLVKPNVLIDQEEILKHVIILFIHVLKLIFGYNIFMAWP